MVKKGSVVSSSIKAEDMCVICNTSHHGTMLLVFISVNTTVTTILIKEIIKEACDMSHELSAEKTDDQEFPQQGAP